MACSHTNRIKVGETWACVNCGLTMLPNGKIYFDRGLIGYKGKKKKKRKAVSK